MNQKMTYEQERIAANSYENQLVARYGTGRKPVFTQDYLSKEAAEIEAIVRTSEMFREGKITYEQYEAIEDAVTAWCKNDVLLTGEKYLEIIKGICGVIAVALAA